MALPRVCTTFGPRTLPQPYILDHTGAPHPHPELTGTGIYDRPAPGTQGTTKHADVQTGHLQEVHGTLGSRGRAWVLPPLLKGREGEGEHRMLLPCWKAVYLRCVNVEYSNILSKIKYLEGCADF